jgi:hypothetical protein
LYFYNMKPIIIHKAHYNYYMTFNIDIDIYYYIILNDLFPN